MDEVRYLGNRSSGRMGRELARASALSGHATTLLLGPTHLEPPEHSLLEVHRFRSTDELASLLTHAWPGHDILLMAAAVADYRPARVDETAKLKREKEHILELEGTPDLLAELAGTSRPDQIRIGWALGPKETLGVQAREKLQRKHLAGIVANPLETIDGQTIDARLLLADGRELGPESSPCSKSIFAVWLLEAALALHADAMSTT